MINETHKKLTLKEKFDFSLKYSLIYASLISLIFAIARIAGFYTVIELRFINYVILFPIGYLGVRAAFNSNKGFINYFNGMMISFLIGFLGQIWFMLIFLTYLLFDSSVYAFLIEQLPQPILYPHLSLAFIMISEGLGASAILALTMMQIFKTRHKDLLSVEQE